MSNTNNRNKLLLITDSDYLKCHALLAALHFPLETTSTYETEFIRTSVAEELNYRDEIQLEIAFEFETAECKPSALPTRAPFLLYYILLPPFYTYHLF